MTALARCAPALLYSALSFIDRQRHAVTSEQIIAELKCSRITVCRIVSALKADRVIKVGYVFNKSNQRFAVYYPARVAMVAPPRYSLPAKDTVMPKTGERRRAVRLEPPAFKQDALSLALFAKVAA
jgi:hypothetical protein